MQDGVVLYAPLTEDEYRAWVAWKLPRLANLITRSLPQAVQDAGLRFEYSAGSEEEAHPQSSSSLPSSPGD